MLATESLYQTFPTYGGPPPHRRMAVELTFRRPPPENSGGGEDGGDGMAASAPPGAKDVTIMTVQVGPLDSIDSLNRRIRVSN